MLIQGYDDGPLVSGEPLVGRPGFWANYLMAMCADGTCVERPAPEWFGDDGADCDSLSETLLDPERWPVFRVPAADGPGVAVIYRNLVGDYDIDYLLTHPDGSYAQRIANWEGHLSGTGLTWQELIRTADAPSCDAKGVQDRAARLLLVLPLCNDLDIPPAALSRVTDALLAAGAPEETATATARHLLGHVMSRPSHDPGWDSPLSHGGR
ncbi:hypothetical protein AB0F18_13125 [Streptomyces sp. NPDC029216]|uniref:hypothetical protein n=1 Tax=Streptomyces sp. NPDC029216 TaxID=3154701 RepID=UPI0033F957C8